MLGQTVQVQGVCIKAEQIPVEKSRTQISQSKQSDSKDDSNVADSHTFMRLRNLAREGSVF